MLVADTGALTTASGQVDVIADSIADVDVATPLGQVSDALVGSETSQACLWLATRMGAGVQVYAERLHNLADNSRDTATGFCTVDQSVASGYGTGR